MIVEEIFYGVKCNRCLEIHDDGEHSYWSDKSGAMENAMNSDWIEVKNKDYCPNCYFLNEETDENEIKEPFGEHVLALKRFIKTSLLAHLNIYENDVEDVFVFTFKRFKESTLKDYEERFIVELTKGKLISFTSLPDKYGTKEYKIELKK
ncbi:hypothetical protein D3C86_537540 [compost metagenome]